MNAAIHHANGEITRRAIRDFGEKMVMETKYELANQLKADDLDDIADILLEKASNRFLDKALERRLRTIAAKPLINALARAERLGYEHGDIVDEDGERVIPEDNYGQPWGESASLASLGSEAWQSNFAPDHGARQEAYAPSEHYAQPGASGQYYCQNCMRTFEARSAYEHHTKKNVCQRQEHRKSSLKYQCDHCGQGFTTIVGLQYVSRFCFHRTHLADIADFDD